MLLHRTLIAALFVFLTVGCGSRVGPQGDQLEDQAGGEAPGIAAVPAQGWTEVNITSPGWDKGLSKIDIDAVAHFKTSRNSCFKEEAGAILLGDWNVLAARTNQFISAQPLKDPKCFPAPQGEYFFDGTVEVKLPSGQKKLLFETKYVDGVNQVCSYLPDAAGSQQLLSALNHLLPKTFLEGCPQGHP